MKLEPNFQSATWMGGRGKWNALPFRFCPLIVFGIIFNALTNCLSTDRTNVSVLVIVNDGWDLGISANFSLGRKTITLMSGYDSFRYNIKILLPSYSSDFRNLVWVEDATQEVRYRSRKLLRLNWPVWDATKCRANVECEDKFAVWAAVRRPGWHPGCGR